MLRDIVYIHDAIIGNERFDLNDPASITNAVYHILRNARILDYKGKPERQMCRLYLSMMDKMNVRLPKFGDATKALSASSSCWRSKWPRST